MAILTEIHCQHLGNTEWGVGHIEALSPGESLTYNYDVAYLIANVGTGDFYMWGQINTDNVVAESIEDNNNLWTLCLSRGEKGLQRLYRDSVTSRQLVRPV